MYRKLTSWMKGQTVQLARMAGTNIYAMACTSEGGAVVSLVDTRSSGALVVEELTSWYLSFNSTVVRPSMMPILAMNSTSPIGAITAWSASTRFPSAASETLGWVADGGGTLLSGDRGGTEEVSVLETDRRGKFFSRIWRGPYADT